MAFPTGWGRKQKITISSAEVDGSTALTDYPMLITLDHLDSEIVDAGSNSALNGGGDLRFSSDSAGVTQLACEVVDFVTNATEGSRSCEVYVSVPSVSTSVDTDIYVWYKKIGESQPAVTTTYGRNAVWADYEVVSHDGGPTDSTGNTTPSIVGSPTAATGKFTNATDYGAQIDDYYYRATVTDASTFTMQTWAKIAAKSAVAGQGAISLVKNTSERAALAADNSPDDWGIWDNSNSWLRSSQAQEIGVWRSAATVYNGLTDRRVFYSGVKRATDSTVSSLSTGKTTFEMGGSGHLNESWDGDLCETRLRYTGLSDDWISTEYSNQNTPATFATAGTPEGVGGGPTFQPAWAMSSRRSNVIGAR